MPKPDIPMPHPPGTVRNQLPLVFVAGPLTGPRAAYGRLIRERLSMIQPQVPLTLRLLDDQANPEVAQRVAGYAAAAGAAAVIGHFNSDCARAAAPLYRRADVPLLLPASTEVGLADGRGIFRLCADEARQGAAMAAFWHKSLTRLEPVAWRDGSLYGERLYKHLELAIGRPLRTPDLRSGELDNRQAAFYFGTHVAVLARMRDEGTHAPAVSLCCDDCDIDEFDHEARPGTWICAPQVDYGQLLVDAIQIVADVIGLQRAPWSRYFNADGESHAAAWRMRRTAAIDRTSSMEQIPT